MQTLRLILAAVGLALALPLAATAQTIDDMKDLSPQERRAVMESLSPEERRALREQHRAERRARWESMTDEEREAARRQHRERVDRRREHWDSMSEEDKAAARQRCRDHRGGMHPKRRDKRDDDQS